MSPGMLGRRDPLVPRYSMVSDEIHLAFLPHHGPTTTFVRFGYVYTWDVERYQRRANYISHYLASPLFDALAGNADPEVSKQLPEYQPFV